MSSANQGAFTYLKPADLQLRLLKSDERVMVFGVSGIGKTTLAAHLCRSLHAQGRSAGCLSADVGLPGFGVPGAVNLAEWETGGWRPLDLEAVCSLDAARFRLPLVEAVEQLMHRNRALVRVLDTPGLVRGAPAGELLEALVRRVAIDLVIVLVDVGGAVPLAGELSALPVEVRLLCCSDRPRRPGRQARVVGRTRRWDDYLANAQELCVDLEYTPVIGTPPPIDVPQAWCGRQVGLVNRAGTLGLGEISELAGRRLRLRTPSGLAVPGMVLVRNATRNGKGQLVTAKPFAQAVLQYHPPPDVRPFPGAAHAGGDAPVTRVGSAFATLVNGVFGDPLLHFRLRQVRRSLLFDLGDAGRLPARIAHQITDVFITHAHFDHIGGFLWLLRSRLGNFPVCRLYGPPGLAGHIEGMLQGILWDRIGERGPRFEVAELHGARILRWHLRAGEAAGARYLGESTTSAGLLLEEPGLRVYATTLDHGTPVLAYAIQLPMQLNVRKDRLEASGMPVGPWVTELKTALLAGENQRSIRLPDGSCKPAAVLADELVRVAPGAKLVYATDFADTRCNREILAAFAGKSQILFCEASFLTADADQAQRTGHLTARACGEIATEADVTYLVPFHFSRRYEKDPDAVYAEVGAVCSRLVAPRHGIAVE